MSYQGLTNLHVFYLLAVIMVACDASKMDSNATVIFYANIPAEATEINEGEKAVIAFNYSVISSSNLSLGIIFISARIEDADIAVVELLDKTSFNLSEQFSDNFTVIIMGVFVGRTYLHVVYTYSINMSLHNETKVTSMDNMNMNKVKFMNSHFNVSIGSLEDEAAGVKYYSRHEIVTVRRQRPEDLAFTVIVIVLISIVNLGLGCKTDIETIKLTLRNPIAPLVGFCSQFIIMPLTSFAAVKLFGLDPAMGLGFFALGCCPGGSASNAYTMLLKGDVTLSITMTFISTLAAFVMIPLWLFTLGKVLYSGTSIKIPFQNIFTSLISLLLAVVIGLVIKHFRPKWAKVMVKVSKVLMVIFIILVLTFGVYTNLYIFQLLSLPVLLAAAFLPYVGFILGGLVAFLCRLDRKRVLTIAIETGIQNTGIAIFILLLSLPHPESDISIAAPIASALFTPLPLWIAIAVLNIRQCCCKKTKDKKPSQTEMCTTPTDDPAVDEGHRMITSTSSNVSNEPKSKDVPMYKDSSTDTPDHQ